MPKLPPNPRPSRQELRDLARAASNLMVVHESLQHTNWAGAAPCASLVAQAINPIVAFYRRASIHLPEVIAEREAQALASQQQEDGAQDVQEPAPQLARRQAEE